MGDRILEQLAREIVRLVLATGPSWPGTWGLQLVSTSRPSTILGGQGCLVPSRDLATEVCELGGRVFRDHRPQCGAGLGGGRTDRLARPGDGRSRRGGLTPGSGASRSRGLERCWDLLAAAGVAAG